MSHSDQHRSSGTPWCYVRRVAHPNPVSLELARQAVDSMGPARPNNYLSIAQTALKFGVSINYLLDEIERRVRETLPEAPAP